MKTLCLLILFLLAGWIAPANAQTTRPAPAAWDQVVQAVAKSLTVAGDEAKDYLSDDCSVRSFELSSKQLADVAAHSEGATLLLAKAYVSPGGAIAGDIGAAVNDSLVSDDVKKLLVPAEGD